MKVVQTVAWLICVFYSTIPLFWLMVHPRARAWRQRASSPYRILLPAWVLMWLGVAALTGPWQRESLYSTAWSWFPALLLFAGGIYLYTNAGVEFSLSQLGGLPEVRVNEDNRLVTSGIRAHVRHPVYLAHLCEMLAWSTGTGLIVCWLLTAFGILTGAVMIRLEDAELEKRFGEQFRQYRESVGAVWPRLGVRSR